MIASVLMILIGATSQCAIIGTDGEHGDFWDDGAVIYAEVVSVEKVDKSMGHLIHLKPIATLTGNFDSALEGEVTAGTAIGQLETDIKQAPPKSAKVIALIERRQGFSTYGIRNGSAAFFPLNERKDSPCLFEVTGFDDPKVTETIENLRKLRGKQREAAEKAPAEKKPAAEKSPAEQNAKP